ncbi:hypothetical protein Zm00014a_041657 [Zea mays]|uniref:Uncharacterized protein n=1 Tax=Zea mays TaxID=4577 RepID=A0A3L6ENW1_MAIZE|nr:hypothetical protein Zm00014a_041657 [Zea mays]
MAPGWISPRRVCSLELATARAPLPLRASRPSSLLTPSSSFLIRAPSCSSSLLGLTISLPPLGAQRVPLSLRAVLSSMDAAAAALVFSLRTTLLQCRVRLTGFPRARAQPARRILCKLSRRRLAVRL